ncbi:hypothetical protein BN7_5846 [Wickerhamomyces ciferrii]|uniref:N-alpha-acetyltransferase, 35 NatC auxiliary subunit n=1 Tax=Wickerhamomyces ciferrii (strain ATCC 14091 / BCRC 22168 / CBS 111 / JCM 3599 / NBRC 0793 / NRRL Y-1031 F-60-10) TaxID=1206466 RepID=K0KXR8_WICCF|nr:uncharacterized protein BN7_5846 [Wickerhamomyces ciferrii]CCH46254.1 hypothetical protein BN7_5846 [Wickerhamomyces ciferrii]
MVSSAIASLDKISLDSKEEQEHKVDSHYTDITKVLFTQAQKLKTGSIIKSPHFSLFEGTHALEVTNNKLDSGLIKLTEEELKFDYKKGRSLNEVLQQSDAILRSVFVWLNNSSLPVTVFSNRYVEQLLVNYTKDVRNGLNSCKFYDSRYEKVDEMASLELQLVHKVLRSVVLGVLHFVRLCLTLGQAGVVYEEEDINTQNMNLDVLSLIGSDQVLKEIINSINFLSKHFPDSKDSTLITNILQILKKLIDLPFYLSIKIPRNSFGKNVNTEVLDSLLKNCQIMQQNIDYLNSLPELPGAFSVKIQKTLDNRSPTRDLVPPKQEDYSSLNLLLTDLQHIFYIKDRTSVLDLKNYTLNFANQTHHTISRAFFPLFLIRDDRTVLGVEQFSNFLLEDLISFSCCDSNILSTDNLIAKNKVIEFIDQVTIVYFEWFNTMNQNPCRQRTHLSRMIPMLDSLEASSETLELELENVFQIKDLLIDNTNEASALPITSWIHYQKLDVMLQVVLRGFELDVYKVWEYHSMYWYANYLVDHIEAILLRVVQCNNSKINSIKDMNKKLKKKTGEQKQKFKEKLQLKQDFILPKLIEANESIEKLILKNQIIRELCHLQIYNLNDLINRGFLKIPDFPFIKDDSQLYNLRMKPFSTVGSPITPKYDEYLNESKQINISKERSNELKKSVNEHLKQFLELIEQNDKSVGMQLNQNDWINWFKELQKSSIGIVLTSLTNQQVSNDSISDYRPIIVSTGFHRYFPIVKLEKK